MKAFFFITVCVVALALPVAAQQTGAIDLLSKALYEENVIADFTKACQIYQQILKDFPQDKKSCAQATYRLGICAERTNSSNSEEYFIAVIEKFPSEADLVEKARAKLSNTKGVQYFTDTRDGHRYKYVTIGKQAWMAENVAYLPRVSPLKEQGGIWVYDYDGIDVTKAKSTDSFRKYGCLYDWPTANQICPEGWHLPSEKEWIELERRIGIYDADNEEGIEVSLNPNYFRQLVDPKNWIIGYLPNKTQVRLIPGGYRFTSIYNTSFRGQDQEGPYWTSSQVDIGRALNINLYGPTEEYFKSINSKAHGYAVRCIKNEFIIPTEIKAPILMFTNMSTSGGIYRDFQDIQIRIQNNQAIEKVDFKVITKGGTTLLGTDYQGQNYPGFYYIRWDTRKFPDGPCELIAEAVSYSGKIYTLKGNYTILNNVISRSDGVFKDQRDQQSYPYVKIGNQVWMARNLNYNLGDGNESICYKKRTANCEIYGRLYNRKVAKSVCPEGWHLPNIEEWKILEKNLSTAVDSMPNHVKDTTLVGYKMKSVSGWAFNAKTLPGNGIGDNSSGFNLLPGGMADLNSFLWKGSSTGLWSSTDQNDFETWCVDFSNQNNSMGKYYQVTMDYLLYVRCLKD